MMKAIMGFQWMKFTKWLSGNYICLILFSKNVVIFFHSFYHQDKHYFPAGGLAPGTTFLIGLVDFK